MYGRININTTTSISERNEEIHAEINLFPKSVKYPERNTYIRYSKKGQFLTTDPQLIRQTLKNFDYLKYPIFNHNGRLIQMPFSRYHTNVSESFSTR